MTKSTRIPADRRGFTMLTTSTLIAIVAVSALVVLDMIDLDFAQVAQQRSTMESREAAEGGLMELLNDQDVLGSLPTLETTNLRTSHVPTSASVFGQSHEVKGSRDFAAEIELIRSVPMLESSHTVVRALVYDVRVRARAGSGGTSRIAAEVFRISASKPGTVLPRMHAR